MSTSTNEVITVLPKQTIREAVVQNETCSVFSVHLAVFQQPTTLWLSPTFAIAESPMGRSLRKKFSITSLAEQVCLHTGQERIPEFLKKREKENHK